MTRTPGVAERRGRTVREDRDMAFAYTDRAVARHFESHDSEELTNQLTEYFRDLATRDAHAQVTVLAGPQVWSTPDGKVHALLVVTSESGKDPYDGCDLDV
ncbi:hypothetical protein [Leekyejoonella antrihumi]|uniref:Uncharacterized protein n=1 Tax=Leekyejoonella antrihumi TaxID=1660198 RepID=A0A563DNF6_9MICO|nr:hypothetical protein [Leekyejoonella antrihumi]TWP31705.1 hypothetical protein FGL98_25040 [Leekyejoonella antrihumi]